MDRSKVILVKNVEHLLNSYILHCNVVKNCVIHNTPLCGQNDFNKIYRYTSRNKVANNAKESRLVENNSVLTVQSGGVIRYLH